MCDYIANYRWNPSLASLNCPCEWHHAWYSPKSVPLCAFLIFLSDLTEWCTGLLPTPTSPNSNLFSYTRLVHEVQSSTLLHKFITNFHPTRRQTFKYLSEPLSMLTCVKEMKANLKMLLHLSLALMAGTAADWTSFFGQLTPADKKSGAVKSFMLWSGPWIV